MKFMRVIKIDKCIVTYIIVCVAFILQDIFKFHIDGLLNFSFILLYDLLIIIVIIIMLIGAIIYLVKSRRKVNIWARLLPMFISVFLIVILVTSPMSKIGLNVQYTKDKSAYKKIVSMIESEDISSQQGRDIIELPDNYRYLSKGGGEIIVIKSEKNLSVLFFTVRGITDNYSGFVYVSDDSQSTLQSLYSDVIQCAKKEDCWYWISCT